MLKNDGRKLEGVDIGTLDASEIGAALEVVARGMRDNPTHIAAFGEDPEIRQRRVHKIMTAAFSIKDFSQTLVARDGDCKIVGVCGMMLPGDCRPTIAEQLRLLPRVLSNGPRGIVRMARWMGAWAKHDPDERHWHVGPLAVDAHLQGMGIGSKLMRVFCARMDAVGEDAYLETDKPINVRFYERFGFEVIGEQDVIGVSSWFMLRRPDK